MDKRIYYLLSTAGSKDVDQEILKVLFLCTGNSARSIIAEALLQRWGRGKFEAYSAGSKPRGQVNPLAVELLKKSNFKPDDFRSKSWEEFAQANSPKMDFVFTVCDNAANESCPVWPGQPISAHWGIEDPDRPDLSLDEQRRLFRRAFIELDHRIKIFTSLPIDKLSRLSLQEQVEDIGRSFPDAS